MAEKFDDASKVILRLSDLTSEPKRMLPPIKGFENQPLVSLEQSIQPLRSFVPDLEQMVWTVKQNCEKPEDDLTSDESGSIMLYTLEWEPPQSSFYRILNRTLRSENRQELRHWFSYLRLIICALAKLPSLPSRTIYRGVQIDMSQDFIKDKTLIWWAFSSCTSTIDVIQHFLGHNGHRTIINIESDSAKDISRHSFYQRENEILLYPARQFKVISSLDTGNQLHIIQLKEISPPFPLIHIPQINSTLSTTISLTPINNSYRNQKLKDRIKRCQPRSEVKLSNQNLTDEDMYIVVREAIVNKQCNQLWLSWNKISSVGVSIIAKILNENTPLEMLMLSYNDLGDMSVHWLVKSLSLNNSSLSILHLSSTGITDEGAGYLAEMLKSNSTLKCLVLNTNNIGDRGVELVANALINHNTTLTQTFLNENKLVSDASIDILVQMLQQNHSLSYLNISKCNLSEKGKDRLRQVTKPKTKFRLYV